MNMPEDDVTRAYIACLFDGEGCITRANDHPVIQVGMTDEPVIRWLGKTGGTIRVEDHPNRGNRKPLYRWRALAGNDVAAFLRAIFPFLQVKRQQAEDAIVEIEGLNLLWAGEA